MTFNTDYIRQLRTPFHSHILENDIYIRNKGGSSSSSTALYNRCIKLLNKKDNYGKYTFKDINLYGLGAAIYPTILLSLKIIENYDHTYELSCETSTQELIDDFIPKEHVAHLDTFSKVRKVSSISINIKRKNIRKISNNIQYKSSNTTKNQYKRPKVL